MSHPIHRVTGFARVAPFCLEVVFEDGTKQTIDFRPVLHGELYGSMADPGTFDKVVIDKEAQTLVWPNGADFDPAILHDWPEKGPVLAELAEKWAARVK